MYQQHKHVMYNIQGAFTVFKSTFLCIFRYQGLSESSSPEVFEQFITHHQCNYYCGLLGLRPLKTIDSLQQPGKMKGSRSPLLNRKLSTGSSSPHLQKKGSHSPHSQRKASPKVPRKAQETEEDETNGKVKSVETAFEMR